MVILFSVLISPSIAVGGFIPKSDMRSWVEPQTWYSPALLSNPFNPISISWLTWLRVMVTLELNVLHFTFDGSPAVSTCLRSIRIMGFVSAFNVW